MRPGERPPSLDPDDPRRRGRLGRVRRRLGYALLLLSAVLTVWSLRQPATAPLPTDGAAAPQGCAAGAPAEATPVSLPQPHVDSFSPYLGTLVCFTHDLTVTEVYDLGRFGELLLADARLFGANTGREGAQGGLRTVRLSAGERPEYAWPLAWGLAPGDVRVGDVVLQPYGLLGASPRGGYALVPPTGAAGSEPAFEARSERPTAAPPRRGDLRVAAFNLGNFFVTLGERGARDPAELERQTAKLVAALLLLDADVLALIEVERGGEALARLRDALNEALAEGGSERRYRAAPSPPGGLAGDVVTQGFLYDPVRLELLGVRADAAGVHLRPPQAITLLPRGAERPITLVAVHHRSRASCPARGDVDVGFGCWNRTRTEQSAALLAFAEQLAGTVGSDDVLVLGDLNAHRFEPPIEAFTATGGDGADAAWQVLLDRVPPEEAYSYVFFGRSAALDHAIASHALAERVVLVAYLPINADEPPLLAARVPPGLPQAYAPHAYRSSDHDPLIVDMDLGGAREPVTGGR